MSTDSISDPNRPATQDELFWWYGKAPTLKWTWAKTYESFAPHWYVVEGKTADMTREEYIRVGRIIRTFGEPGKFYSRTSLYLFTADRRLKFWAMWGDDPDDGEAHLINLATTERVYGPQTDFDEERIKALRLTGE